MPQSQYHPLQFNPQTKEPFLRLPSPHEHIILTPPRTSDGPAIFSHMSDPRVYSWLEGPPFPYRPEHAEQWISMIKKDADAALEVLRIASEADPDAPPVLVSACPVRCIREVRDDGSDIFLGDIAILRERWPDESDEDAQKALKDPNYERPLGDPEIVWCFGDYIAASHQGRGIMSVAIRTLIHEWAVPRMGVRQIRVETFEENLGSRRVFEKNGFVYEKTTPMERKLESGRLVKGMHILWWKAQ
ncbi:acyl-CoA N-acyltransferase [Epithele typhae]|uniref:acyl-CoA N-acyltransferase n=1 Tax=Epithele typhae TaxID=378194 RepID=UPI00200893E2|nr:acyl-CoA N-acyltransferase [Epithele typhae]KAH9944275.1 acyl-CoA N-acyltransferase [Epithele typhae]